MQIHAPIEVLTSTQATEPILSIHTTHSNPNDDHADKDKETLRNEIFIAKTKSTKIEHHLTFLRDTLHNDNGLKLAHPLQAMDAHMTNITQEWNNVPQATSKSLKHLLYHHFEEL